MQRFLADVLPAAGDTPAQITHGGDRAGLDKATLSALGAFADAFDNEPALFDHIWFDLADEWKGDSTLTEGQALVPLIRQIRPATPTRL